MTVTTDTQQARLARAFETLKNQNITPILVLTGSTGVIEDDLNDYQQIARAVCAPDSWVGAHVGAAERGGANWHLGRLLFRGSGTFVEQIWFSFPRGREDIARALLDALEANAFYASWLRYNADGEAVGPGTDADSVRLVLKEED